MAVYYKFKSTKDYFSIPIDGHFISVGNLKQKIFESKLGRGTDFDLVVTNAQTNEEYGDEAMLIPKNASVIVQRVPGRPRMPIVTGLINDQEELKVENKPEDVHSAKSGFLGADSSVMEYPEDSELDEFGNDCYIIPEATPLQSSNPTQDVLPPCQADEDSKIKALIEASTLEWQHQTPDRFGTGRGFGRGMGGRMMGSRGFGRGGLLQTTPPQGYVCHRCKVPGHYIKYCPTNGDPNYDIKRVKPPTGIPKSMLMAMADGSYALPSGAVAVLKPNEAAFEKEVEGLPSTCSVGDLPPELHCLLCKEVMKDAVLTSKCCFESFCDRCIRDYIISKSTCVCGATNILADDLLPNKTLRDTINRILESNNSSAENGGSVFQVQAMEFARCPPPMVPSPTKSAASKGDQIPLSQKEEILKKEETTEQGTSISAGRQTLEKERAAKVPEISEAPHESRSMKEPVSQGSALVDEEVLQKPLLGEAGKKKKKKKTRLPLSGEAFAAEMQWNAAQDHLAAESYMMQMGPSAYNPYWNGMQMGMEGYVPPYPGGLPYMGYGFSPLDAQFGGVLPVDPYNAMMPFVPPPRHLVDFGMGFNGGPPVMSRDKFEAQKADLKRKREIEQRGERELSQDWEFGREASSIGDISSTKSKSKSMSPPLSSSENHHHHHNRHRLERSSPDRHARDPELPRQSSKRKSDHHHHHTDPKLPRPPSKRKSEHDHRNNRGSSDHLSDASRASPAVASEPSQPPKTASTTSDAKQKASVFSRIRLPEEEAAVAAESKKRKLSSSSDAAVGASSASHKTEVNGYHEDYKSSSRKSAAAAATAVGYESSDDDRHFKRRSSRYEASQPTAAAAAAAAGWEDEGRQGRRGFRERERERERDRDRERASYSKHR